ncbi:tripartite tricarboxylate transporter TctB family protein (plasmid) [Qingshengfaniella alkalisoli]|uniref:Tripartite tricarboxylate transporter TctB family protein n=1 Tax=Qingshengfaniella alkalisoli TaxID=2599296 RepID=A0A5B8IA50_9RHOB|nr:tripartite tricarboxylate transporter TctB family protein [Qingshengfaniella alkalisoli]
MMRGVLITLFFAIVLFTLIPVYVPRPAFIPGFAPPPDMWPRVVSMIGIALGLVAIFLSLNPKGADPAQPEWEQTAPVPTLLGRLGLILAAFGFFVFLVSKIGFLIATMLLTGAAIGLTGERKGIWPIVISVLLPLLLLLFFTTALGTQFPKGEVLKTFGL